jgi:hypothetical protein
MLCACAAVSAVLAGPAHSAPDADKSRGAANAPAVAPSASKTASAIVRQRDGTLLIGGRSLRCGSNRNVLDRNLPNLGLAAPGVLVFNPRELSRWSDTVRLFVYHHECGHQNVGGSELGADCWAVKRGVSDGWLTRDGLGQICRSFGDGPATETHPSGARRCASLNRCFNTAFAALEKEKAAIAKGLASVQPAAEPKLVQEPVLKRSGMLPDYSKD